MRRQSGFTLMELMVIVAVIGILAGIAVPNFLGWLPKYRLKSSVDELFGNLQLAKMAAIKSGQNCTVDFTGAGYTIASAGLNRSVSLSGYKSGVAFARPAGQPGAAFPASITFNTRGLCNAGYAYLTNSGQTGHFRVGTLTSGVIQIQKWSGVTWQ